jgi:hypothetical protein
VSSLDGDVGPLALPAAQRADAHAGLRGQADRRQRIDDSAVRLRRGRRRGQSQTRRVVQRVLQRQVGVDGVVLRHEADHASEGAQVGVHVEAVEAHRPVRCRRDAGHGLQQRGLAAPLGPTMATSSPGAIENVTSRAAW